MANLSADVILFWPWMPHLHSALIGPPEDNMEDFWNTWYASVATKPDGFFYQFDPLSGRHAPILPLVCLSESLCCSAIIQSRRHKLADLLFLQNMSLLISFPLAGVGAFYLVRHFTQNVAGALVGGFIFAFNPSHVAHVMHHTHVSSIEFIPFFVLSYLLAIEKKHNMVGLGSCLLCIKRTFLLVLSFLCRLFYRISYGLHRHP